MEGYKNMFLDFLNQTNFYELNNQLNDYLNKQNLIEHMTDVNILIASIIVSSIIIFTLIPSGYDNEEEEKNKNEELFYSWQISNFLSETAYYYEVVVRINDNNKIIPQLYSIYEDKNKTITSMRIIWKFYNNKTALNKKNIIAKIYDEIKNSCINENDIYIFEKNITKEYAEFIGQLLAHIIFVEKYPISFELNLIEPIIKTYNSKLNKDEDLFPNTLRYASASFNENMDNINIGFYQHIKTAFYNKNITFKTDYDEYMKLIKVIYNIK